MLTVKTAGQAHEHNRRSSQGYNCTAHRTPFLGCHEPGSTNTHPTRKPLRVTDTEPSLQHTICHQQQMKNEVPCCLSIPTYPGDTQPDTHTQAAFLCCMPCSAQHATYSLSQQAPSTHQHAAHQQDERGGKQHMLRFANIRQGQHGLCNTPLAPRKCVCDRRSLSSHIVGRRSHVNTTQTCKTAMLDNPYSTQYACSNSQGMWTHRLALTEPQPTPGSHMLGSRGTIIKKEVLSYIIVPLARIAC